LQRRLTQILIKAGVTARGTNLVLNHCVADIVDQATNLLGILDIFEETLDLALLFQQLEFVGNIIEFPDDPCRSALIQGMESDKITAPKHSSWTFP
jgi:hypothetical protein